MPASPDAMETTVPHKRFIAAAARRILPLSHTVIGPLSFTRTGSLPDMDPAQLASLHPTLYHMAEDGSWPSIRERGLLSTQAIIDLYQPDEQTREAVLSSVRRTKITLTSPDLGDITIRDQIPAKFLEKCMHDGVDPAEYLDALNSRVFFWVSLHRLERLLDARHYRHLRHTVLRVDTAALLEEYAARRPARPVQHGQHACSYGAETRTRHFRRSRRLPIRRMGCQAREKRRTHRRTNSQVRGPRHQELRDKSRNLGRRAPD